MYMILKDVSKEFAREVFVCRRACVFLWQRYNKQNVPFEQQKLPMFHQIGKSKSVAAYF